MKTIYRIFALVLITLSTDCIYAQSTGEDFVREADRKLQRREYTTARYMYGKAYSAYVEEGKIDKAIQAIVNMSALYNRERLFKQALDHLSTAESHLRYYEETNSIQLPTSHYLLAKEREKIYIKMNRQEGVRDQLERMRSYANAANDTALNMDLLTESVRVYYLLGMTEKGEEAANQLIDLSLSTSDIETTKERYRLLIEQAVKTGNAQLTQKAYDKYLVWNDSIAEVKAEIQQAEVKVMLQEAENKTEELENEINAKEKTTIGLLILAAALAAGLVFVTIVLFRLIARARRQKRAIATAQEHNHIKTTFLSNISAQLEPTLDTLPANIPAAKALKEFAGHIQELSDLEATQNEMLQTEPVNIYDFCESIAEKARSKTAKDVTITVTAPKMNAPLNEENARRVLDHLMSNAAEYTPEGGKITLEFKKRGPHNIQFIITDTGCGISEEQRETLFKPFSSVRDLTKGDGLGLPICSMLITKMNGIIMLDREYTHGTRFIVELHP